MMLLQGIVSLPSYAHANVCITYEKNKRNFSREHQVVSNGNQYVHAKKICYHWNLLFTPNLSVFSFTRKKQRGNVMKMWLIICVLPLIWRFVFNNHEISAKSKLMVQLVSVVCHSSDYVNLKIKTEWWCQSRILDWWRLQNVVIQ